MRKLILFTILLTPLTACNFGLTSPSNPGDVRSTWSPFVGVHPFSPIERPQQPHLQKLIDAGQLRGVRAGADITNTHLNVLYDFLAGNGVDILAIFPNEYLRSPNVLEIFAQHVSAFPSVNTWEIGNEVGLFITMEPEEYMPIFKKIFYYAKENFPNVTIAAEAPVGNGGGSDVLRRMIDLGLKDMFDDGLTIVTIHFYSWRSTRLEEFKSQIARLPPQRRIWVTETNQDAAKPSWEEQISFVNSIYPLLRNNLSAERIYWYDFAECGEFALVKGLPDSCRTDPPIYSPLMNALLGVQ